MTTVISGRSKATKGNGSYGLFSAWIYRVALEIDHTLVPSLQTGIPITITNLPSWIYAAALNGGGDLRASSDLQGVNQVSIDVVTFDTGTESCELHIYGTSISSVVDSKIYLFFGMAGVTQPAAGALGGRYGVYDSDYLSIYHCNTANDSLDNNSGVFSGNYQTGQIRDGMDFEMDVGEEFDCGAWSGSSSLDAVTVEQWIRPETIGAPNRAILMADGEITATIHLEQTNMGNAFLFILGNAPNFSSAQTWPVATWNYLAMIYDSIGETIEYGKGLDWSIGNFTIAQSLNLDTQHTFAAHYVVAFHDFFDGMFDEIRISKTNRSEDWCDMSYNNQLDPAAFVTVNQFVH